MSTFEFPACASMDDLRDWLNENLDKPNMDIDDIQFNYENHWSHGDPDSITFQLYDVNERAEQNELYKQYTRTLAQRAHVKETTHKSLKLREQFIAAEKRLGYAEMKLAKTLKGLNNPSIKDKPFYLSNLKKMQDRVQNLKNHLEVIKAKRVQLDAELERCETHG